MKGYGFRSKKNGIRKDTDKEKIMMMMTDKDKKGVEGKGGN